MEAAKIVLADPNQSTRYATALELLLEEGNYHLLTAETGGEVLRLVKSQTPEVLLLAIDLSEPDGYTLCQRLKIIPRLTHVPIALLAGQISQKVQQAAKAAQADMLLSKTTPGKDLRRLLKGLCRVSISRLLAKTDLQNNSV